MQSSRSQPALRKNSNQSIVGPLGFGCGGAFGGEVALASIMDFLRSSSGSLSSSSDLRCDEEPLFLCLLVSFCT